MTASDAAAGDYFGISVGIDNNIAIIGAYRDNVFAGSAYLFEPCPCTLSGDLNNDCLMGTADLSVLQTNWLTTMDLTDLALVAEYWLVDCFVTPFNSGCIGN